MCSTCHAWSRVPLQLCLAMEGVGGAGLPHRGGDGAGSYKAPKGLGNTGQLNDFTAEVLTSQFVSSRPLLARSLSMQTLSTLLFSSLVSTFMLADMLSFPVQ